MKAAAAEKRKAAETKEAPAAKEAKKEEPKVLQLEQRNQQGNCALHSGTVRLLLTSHNEAIQRMLLTPSQ